MMFSFFKRSKDNSQVSEVYEFNHELIGCALAYEVARADGNIDINDNIELTPSLGYALAFNSDYNSYLQVGFGSGIKLGSVDVGFPLDQNL